MSAYALNKLIGSQAYEHKKGNIVSVDSVIIYARPGKRYRTHSWNLVTSIMLFRLITEFSSSIVAARARV